MQNIKMIASIISIVVTVAAFCGLLVFTFATMIERIASEYNTCRKTGQAFDICLTEGSK